MEEGREREEEWGGARKGGWVEEVERRDRTADKEDGKKIRMRGYVGQCKKEVRKIQTKKCCKNGWE
jgi:hypothetical protein